MEVDTTRAREAVNLVDDAPGNDRTDAALKRRSSDIEGANALDDLLRQANAAQAARREAAPADTADPAATAVPEYPYEAPSIGADIGKGIVETPRAIVKGVRDAGQEVLDLTDAVGDSLQKWMPLGAVQIFDEGWNFDPKYIPSDKVDPAKTGVKLPDIGAPDSVTGGAIKSITQFLAGFGAAGKALSGIKAATTGGKIAKAAAQGAVADFAVFDEHEARLSNMIEQYPALKNPVTAYLSASEDDSVIEGRFKNAVEGLMAGAVADSVLAGLRVVRNSRLKRQGGQAGAAASTGARPEDVARTAGDTSLLGSSKAPVIDNITRSSEKGKATVKEVDAAKMKPGDIKSDDIPPGTTKLEGSDNVFVNFARIDTADDITNVIGAVAKKFKPSIDKARRGVQSNKTTEQLADEIDGFNVLVKRRKGDPLNAEQSLAARRVWTTAGKKLFEVAEVAAASPSSENLFQFRKMLAIFHGVQKEVVAARAETARALQAWSIPAGHNKTALVEMEKTLAQYGGNNVSQALAKSFALAGKAGNRFQQALSIAEKSVYAKTLGSVQEYWINALLSGPKTHLVNMMSNTSVLGLSIMERGLAGRLARTFETEAGVEIGEALSQTFGLVTGIKDAFRNAARTFKTGNTGFGVNKVEFARDKQISSTTWNLRSESWLGRGVDALGAITGSPVRALAAEDEFFKTVGYRMELHAQAHRLAVRDLREGRIKPGEVKGRIADIVADPPEAIQLESVYAAAYQTFTNTNQGKIAQGMRGLLEKRPELRFILPFLNTPANILKFTFERTPLAPMLSSYRAALRKGGAEADLVQARMALGTMTMLAAIDMAMGGNITGSGPEDWREKQNWRRQGNQPYSIKIGDNQIAYNRMDPLGYTIGMGADIAEYINNADPNSFDANNVEEMMAAAIGAISQNVTSKTYMRGVTDAIDAINRPEQKMKYFISRFAGSFAPTAFAEVARFNDPVQRASHDIVTSIKRRVPGYTKDLPARRDLWGRQIEYGKGFGPVYNAISPLYGSKFKPEPVDAAMEREGFFLSMPMKYMVVKGHKTAFRNRPDIYSRFVELSGGTKPSTLGRAGRTLRRRYGNKTLLQTLNAIVTGKGRSRSRKYERAATPEEKKAVLNKVMRDYRRAAKQVLIGEFPELEGE